MEWAIAKTGLKQIAKYLDKNDRYVLLLDTLNINHLLSYFKNKEFPSLSLLEYIIKENTTTFDNFVNVLEQLGFEAPLLLLKDIEPIKIVKQPPKEICLNENERLKIECMADGFPHPIYQWFKHKHMLQEGNCNIYTINNIKCENEGPYVCRVNNAGMKNSLFSTWCLVKINKSQIVNLRSKLPFKAPKITRNPMAFIEINEFSSFTLMCIGIGIPNVLYQWFKEGRPLDGQISSTLQIYNVHYNDEGVFQCRVYNDVGSVWSCQSQVKITKAKDSNNVSQLIPDIIYHPQIPNEKIAPGSSIILACKAIGKEPLHYEWYRNSKILTSCETSELRLLNIQSDTEDGGCYQCRVYNSYGSILSKPAEIKIDHCSEICQLTATDKVAVLFGNYAYSPILTPLATVENDVKALNEIFCDMGFRVITHTNLTYQDMLDKVSEIHQLLNMAQGPRIYFIFYFGGHGFEMNGKSYLVPIPPSQTNFQNSHFEFKNKGICVETDILNRLNSRPLKPSLIVLLLDICRLEEHNDSFHSISTTLLDLGTAADDNLAQSPNEIMNDISADIGGNYIFGYATSTSHRAFEMEGQTHSIFVTHLLKFITLPLPIEDVLRKTRQSVFAKEPLAKLNNQYPEIKSNLSRNFSLTDKIVKF